MIGWTWEELSLVVDGSVGCVNMGSHGVSLFRNRCGISGNVTCGSCIVVSSGVTIVSAISTGFARR